MTSLRLYPRVLAGIFLLIAAVYAYAGTPESADNSSNLNPTTQEKMRGAIDPRGINSPAEYIIATDFVNSLVQVKGLAPDEIELYLKDSKNHFGKRLTQAFDAGGYQVHLSAVNASAVATTFIIIKPETDQSSATAGVISYQIEVGRVQLRRDYEYINDLFIPRSPMYIRGASSENIKSRDNIFVPKTQLTLIAANEKYNGGVNRVVQSSKAQSTGVTPKSVANSTVEKTKIPQPTATADSTSTTLPQINLQTEYASVHKEGEPIVLSIILSQDSSLYCYYQDGDGNIAKIFPNRFSPENRLKAGQKIQIPNTDKWQLLATKTNTNEEFLCIAAGSEIDKRLTDLKNIPDLQPLSVNSLPQVYEKYTAIAGYTLGNQKMSVEVY